MVKTIFHTVPNDLLHYSKLSRLPHVLEPVEKTSSGAFRANVAISPSPVLYAVLALKWRESGTMPVR